MLKKMLCVWLSICLLNGLSLAQSVTKEEQFRTKVVNWGLHKTVTVRFNSGKQVKGRITEIKDEFLTLQIEGQSNLCPVRFSEIDKLSGHLNWGSQKTRNYVGLIGAMALATFVVVKITQSNDRTPKTIIFSRR
jgi:sRNA-binding regulator protein Hfq